MRTAFTRIEFAVVAVILGGLVALLFPAIQRARNPKGPPGETIPTATPVESNRITHPTGLSIIAPVNWDQIRDQGPETPFLCIAARGVPARRLKSVIMIELCEPIPEAQTLASCQKIQFQTVSAYERMRVERDDTFDDPASSSYDLYVDRDGEWWHVNFLVAKRFTTLPKEIRQYIDTIKFPVIKAQVDGEAK